MAKKRIHYFWNPETLSFERTNVTIKDKIFTFIRHLLVAAFGGLVVLALINMFFDSPRVRAVQRENDRLQTQYELLLHRINEAYEVMEDLQDRDNNMYRALLHAEPIPVSIRKASYLGTQRYDSLQDLTNATLVTHTTQGVDILRKQLYVQAKSYDELIGIFRNRTEYAESVPAIQPISNKDLKLTASGFGVRIDPIYGTPRFHSGMDFSADRGTEIFATGKGVVTQADWEKAYGKTVIIDHGFGYKTMYAHLDNYAVKKGDNVVRGQVIGYVGNTGKATGMHLHYEVIYKGTKVNPVNYYYMDLTPEEYERMVQIATNSGHVYD